MKYFAKVESVVSFSPFPYITETYGGLCAGNGLEIADEYNDEHDPCEMITRGREYIMSAIITGDSMIPYIGHGFRVYIDPYAEIQNGDPIAAWLNGEVTAKFFELTDKGLYLVSGNNKYKPRKVVKKDDFRIIGKIEWFVGKAKKLGK